MITLKWLDWVLIGIALLYATNIVLICWYKMEIREYIRLTKEAKEPTTPTEPEG